MSFTDSGSGTVVIGSTQSDQIGTAGPGGGFNDSNSGTIVLGATESDQLTTTVVGAPPAVSTVTPNSGPVGTPVIIRGINFTGATIVRVVAAGLPATSMAFTVISATQINATIPQFGSVVVDIVVTTPSGTSAIASGDKFTIISGAPLPPPPPVIESLVLDPHQVAINRTEFDITPYVGGAGPDWGNAEITQYLAEAGQFGQVAIDYKVPNRTVSIPLTIQDRGLGLTFEQVRANLQKKVGLFQSKGGWMKRATSVGNLYAEIVGASLHLGGSTAQATQQVDTDAVLTLITLPDWYGDEITLGTQTCTNATVVTIPPPIHGDFPGRVRIQVNNTNTPATTISSVIWGIQGGYQTFQGNTIYDSSTFTTSQASVISGAGTGSISSNVISATLNNARENFGFFDTQLGVGRYRVWARAKCTTDNVILSVQWTNAFVSNWVQNTAVSFSGTFGWQLLDLGEISIESIPLSSGTYQTYFEINGETTALGSMTVLIDQIYLVPMDDGYGWCSILRSNPLEVRTDGVFTRVAPAGRIVGDLPRLPTSGMENYKTQIFLRPSTTDFDTLTDAIPLNYTAQIIYSPCYLVVPES